MQKKTAIDQPVINPNKRFNGFLPAKTIAEDAMGGIYQQNGNTYYCRRACLTQQPGPLPINSDISFAAYLSADEKLKVVRREHDPELA